MKSPSSPTLSEEPAGSASNQEVEPKSSSIRNEPTITLALIVMGVALWIVGKDLSQRTHSTPHSLQRSEFVIEINEASAAELRLLPGIGEKMADAIITHRDLKGPFQSVEELKQIAGIADTRLDRLRPYLAVSQPSDSPRGRQAAEK